MKEDKQRKKYPKVISTKISDELYERLCADADACDKSLSAHVRDRLTRGRRVYAKTDQQMLNELRRIGGLIKHVKAPREIQDALDKIEARII